MRRRTAPIDFEIHEDNLINVPVYKPPSKELVQAICDIGMMAVGLFMLATVAWNVDTIRPLFEAALKDDEARRAANA